MSSPKKCLSFSATARGPPFVVKSYRGLRPGSTRSKGMITISAFKWVPDFAQG